MSSNSEGASSDVDEETQDETKTSDSNDKYQGPHNWRKSLKPVQSPVKEQLPVFDGVGNDVHAEHPLETEAEITGITSPSVNGGLPQKPKRPTTVKTNLNGTRFKNAGNVSPLFVKRRTRVPHAMSQQESAFTRLVVNKPTAPGVPHRRSSLSASASRIPMLDSKRPSAIIRKCSFNSTENPMHNAEAWKRRVDRVMKARLYLLQQMGPNSFFIGGDSPDHKYRVIIGPQRCSCGRGPHCVHILFVMLRVFQLAENDPCLAVKTLKNFEVEALFRMFHARRTSRLQDLSKKKNLKKSTTSADASAEATDPSSSNEDNDTSHQSSVEDDTEGLAKGEEEDTCPICLLEMVEGESLTECANGCQNKLHHHCIAIWFEECRRMYEPLTCPICRAPWKLEDDRGGGAVGQVVCDDPLPVPPNTRASSPQPPPSSHEAEGEFRLPHAEPIPPEHMETARQWIPVLGEEIVSCLFSKNWSVREIGLKQLGRIAQGTLLLGVGAGRAGVVLSPTRQANTNQMLECCCSVLAFLCADPVYKVFVAGLRALRTVLSYTPCRDEGQQASLQDYMKPLVDTILWKCADSNKRTSQLSISALEELVKGQDGELCVGKEIANAGTRGLGGLSYLLRQITQDYDASTVPWQWLLGRFYMLDFLLDDNGTEFIILPFEETSNGSRLSREPYKHYDRVFSVLHFSLSAMPYSHSKVSKMARRVFYVTAKLQIHMEEIFKEILDMLEETNNSMKVYMRRKLLRVMEDSRLSEQPQMTTEELSLEIEDAPNSTPSLSATSTPRCNSPVAPPPSPYSHVGPSINLSVVPEVPPNSPNVKARQNPTGSPLLASSLSTSVHTETDSLCSNLLDLSSDAISVTDSPHKSSVLPKCASSPVIGSMNETLHMSPLGARCTSCENNTSHICHNTDGSYSNLSTFRIHSLPTMSPRRLLTNTHAHEPPITISPSTSHRDCASQTDPQSAAVRPERLFFFPIEPVYGEDKEVQTPDTLSEVDDLDLQIPPADEELEAKGSTDNKMYSTEGVSLTEDLSDLALSPSASGDKVSFKSEIASSPQSGSSTGSAGEGGCHCKEEVEREEAVALAEALERSEVKQEALPHVPGLSHAASADDVDTQTTTITIHQEGVDNEPHQYKEGEHWVRGVMLGTGAFSTCYQARDIKTGTLMAVKQISFCRNSLSEQEKVIEAVEEEIELMSKLNHPNVVRILGATQQGNHFFMFVEWMPGGSVANLLDRYGVFTEQVITSYTQQVLRGLAYLHDNHMLHRDLKGANLLVDSTGQRVRIGDFGASARLASRSTGAGEFQGQLLGTIAFMAPEVLRGESYGRSCDIWGVGCTMIEMVTSKPPWGANDISNHLALIFRIASSENPPPIPENVSPPIRDLMLRCLENDRHDRPAAKDLLKHPLFTMAPR